MISIRSSGLAKLTIGPESTTPGTAGTPYSLQMTATVAEPKTWSISSGALPPGLAIDASTGPDLRHADGGRPVRLPGARQDERRRAHRHEGARDRRSRAGRDPRNRAVHGRPAARSAEVSVPFDALLAATGGTGTYTWSLTSGALPPGLDSDGRRDRRDPDDRGRLSLHGDRHRHRRPRRQLSGAHHRRREARDLDAAPPSRQGRQGFYYQAKLATRRRRPAATWKIVRGPLPRGIRFDRSAGLLFGIPTRPGRYRVTFEATDALGVKAKKTLAILSSRRRSRRSRPTAESSAGRR